MPNCLIKTYNKRIKKTLQQSVAGFYPKWTSIESQLPDIVYILCLLVIHDELETKERQHVFNRIKYQTYKNNEILRNLTFYNNSTLLFIIILQER
jgi:hypothetical protein